MVTMGGLVFLASLHCSQSFHIFVTSLPIFLMCYYVYSGIMKKARRRAPRSVARKRSRDSFPAEWRGLGQRPIIIDRRVYYARFF